MTIPVVSNDSGSGSMFSLINRSGATRASRGTIFSRTISLHAKLIWLYRDKGGRADRIAVSFKDPPYRHQAAARRGSAHSAERKPHCPPTIPRPGPSGAAPAAA